ncbi:MAG: sigma-70 family RNA polymerase sigma factor [Bacteroidia bacterium]
MQEGLVSERQLIEALVNRNKPALSLLYDQYAPATYGIIVRILHDPQAAQDALQDSFMKVWNNIGSFDPDKGRLFTWISQIARNTAIDFSRSKIYKKREIGRLTEKDYTASNPEMEVNTYIDAIGINEWVSRLKPEHKELLDLLYFRGFSHTEAAEHLGLPLGTVKTRARAAISELRKYM